MGRKKKVNNYYWNDEQESLVKQYVIETDPVVRSELYDKFRPSLLVMIESILLRYFGKFLTNDHDLTSTIQDAESNLIETCLTSYNPSLGAKAYSYIGTCVRHHLNDEFFRIKKKESRQVPIEDENGELLYDLPEEVNDSEYIDRIRTELTNRIKDQIKNAPERNAKTITLILSVVLDLVNTVDWSKHYATFKLLQTGLGSGTIYRYLSMYGYETIFYAKEKRSFYENILGEILDENIKDHLNRMNENQNDRYLKVTNGYEKRFKKAEEKRKRKNNLIHEGMG